MRMPMCLFSLPAAVASLFSSGVRPLSVSSHAAQIITHPVVEAVSDQPKVKVLPERIKVANPVVDISGDEMAQIMWESIKQKLILPFLDIPLKEFDLSIQNRDRTDDRVVLEAAEAVKKHFVGAKCATITSNQERLAEFQLKRLYPSPNGTLRNLLDGTIFRAPIMCCNVPRLIPAWKKPIVIARHGYGDIYTSVNLIAEKGSQWTLVGQFPNGTSISYPVGNFTQSGGVVMGMHNKDSSISSFAHACFKYAVEKKWPLYLSTKDTILPQYDGKFREIFAELFESTYQKQGVQYQHRLIDDMVAHSLRSEGGFIWACKNYDGDVQSDALAQGLGSMGLMTSFLLGPDGKVMLTEAAHGTVTRHFRRYQQGLKTSTNPTASIFAWTLALAQRGKLDGNEDLIGFAKALEKACIDVIESGKMTKDLAILIDLDNQAKGLALDPMAFLTLDEFIDAVQEKLSAHLLQHQQLQQRKLV